ncbi:hypothetical protein LCGC14_0981550 [marine sediment metagenome]|uniref:Uncharacterized protein n=1 Tax=marine sediment metagenome TaxID=412755 RepID=A0A0F9NUW8_9ZZZZ
MTDDNHMHMDDELLREALEALQDISTSFKKLLTQVIYERRASDLTPENQTDAAQAERVIAKLEERLLNG